MKAVRAILYALFAERARLRRRRQPLVLLTITIGGLPVFLGWGEEVPFDG